VKRLAATMLCDVRLQLRNGFYAASVFIVVVWGALFTRIPNVDLTAVWGGMIAANLMITTFYFIGGLVLLERDEGTLAARSVTPLRMGEYLGSKVLTLTGLAVLENTLLTLLLAALGFLRIGAGFPLLILGTVLVSVLYCLAGFAAVARYRSINEFLMPSMLYVLALGLPFVDYFGLWRSPLFYLHPLQAALTLMRGSGEISSPGAALYGLLYSAAAIVVFAVLARRAYRQLILSV
jgi:fluoroquinolone transport system permease protein